MNEEYIRLEYERIISGQEKILEGQSDMRDRLTAVEKDMTHLEDKIGILINSNDEEHTKMVSLITELQESDKNQNTILDERTGERRIKDRGWSFIIALISSGAIGGGIIVKILNLL